MYGVASYFIEPLKMNSFYYLRFLLFWEIPTGKCDQKTSRDVKEVMFYRPAWLGQDCKGQSTCMEVDPRCSFVAVGSEDGYMFVYGFTTGIPVGKRKPATKHNGKVRICF